MSALVPILIDFIYHVFLPPFLFVLFLILCLASFGKSLGIRRLYVKWLLKVFKVSYTTQSSICVLCICSAKPIFDNINVFLQFATNLANKARAEQRRQSEVQFRVGSDDTDTEDDNSPGLNGRVNGLGHVDVSNFQLLSKVVNNKIMSITRARPRGRWLEDSKNFTQCINEMYCQKLVFLFLKS